MWNKYALINFDKVKNTKLIINWRIQINKRKTLNTKRIKSWPCLKLSLSLNLKKSIFLIKVRLLNWK